MLAETFIRRPVAIYLLTLGVMLLGWVAYGHLAVSALPQVDLPVIRVSASLPGASPETMASSVATPLERQFSTIAAVNELTSTNSVGNTSVILQFNLNRDIDGAARDVEAAINAAMANLPADLPSPPQYFKANPNAFPILSIALTSDTISQGDIYDFADSIVVAKLSQIEGVAEVDLNGAEKTAVRVQVDPGKLASFNLGMEDVRTAIAQATVNEPKGSLQGGNQAYSIGADDQLFGAENYGRIVVAWKNGAPVRLQDLGPVITSVANTRLGAWYNGKPAVVVQILRQPNANIVETVDRIRAMLPQFERWMPPGIKLSVTLDRTTSIRASIANVQATMLLTIVLVIGVIAIFLRRFWATVIPSVTIPVSIAGTFAAMYPLGYSVDNLSLMALTIAVGFVVDDAIVVIENISRLIETGMTPFEAAVKGTRQIGFTIISITFSLISALIPILFMPGITGRFFREFGMTLSIAIVISAVVSLTLTPTMCAQFLTAHSIADPNAPPAPKGWFGRIFGLWDRWFDRVALGYERSLAKALDRRFLMLGLTLGTIVLTVVLYIYVPKGLLPNQDTGALRGQTQAAPDISYQEMRRRQLAVMAVLATDPAIQDITSNIGSSGFNAPNDGRLNINLKPLDQRGISAQAVIDRLRPKLEKVPGIQTFLSTVQDAGFGARSSRARYQFTLTGPDLGQLTIFVDSIMKRMRLMNGIADVNTDREGNGQAINLVIDRDAAARYGVSVTTIDQTLYDAFGQRQVATTYEELNQYKVVLEVDPRLQGDPQALTHIFVAGSGGSQVPLSAVAKLVRGATPTAVAHQGIQPAITISFNTKDGVSIGTAMADIQATMASIVLPDGVAARFAGDALQASQSNASQPLLIGAALLAVYIVLGVLYESLVHPLTILSTIPSAGLGACLALLITDTELTIIALIGIIMLIGIVKKNAILMVDFALDAERMRGATPKEAIVEAARLRFRPIMMTTFAAVLGALPIALGIGAGSELRQPLGITVVGGLLVSQILTLYTTPVIYLAADRLRGRRSARLRQAIAGE